jgi:hypothetical protein
MKKHILILVMLMLVFGCAAQSNHMYTFQRIVEPPNAFCSITPAKNHQGRPVGFEITVNNPTDGDLEIIWDKTLYICQGQTSGIFMFEGVVYKDRNNPKPSDIVFSKTQLQKTIYPCNLVDFKYISKSYNAWHHHTLPIGENGVYFTLRVNSKEVRERHTVSIKTL